MRRALIVCTLLPIALAGCATEFARRPHVVIEPSAASAAGGWRATATAADQARIDALPARWTAALAAIPVRLRPRDAATKRLLDPAAAEPFPAIPPGTYRCPMRRLGGRSAGRAASLAASGGTYCYVTVEGTKLAFTRQSGSVLPGGWLFGDDDANRLVLLATDRPPVAAAAPPYGVDAKRDIAGVVQRIGPLHWRLVTPRGDDGAIELYDLVPTAEQPD